MAKHIKDKHVKYVRTWYGVPSNRFRKMSHEHSFIMEFSEKLEQELTLHGVSYEREDKNGTPSFWVLEKHKRLLDWYANQLGDRMYTTRLCEL